MANGAKLFRVIYADTKEPVDILVTLGDTIRAENWAEKEYPYPPKPDLSAGLSPDEIDFNREEYREEKSAVDERREWCSGLYAVYLGAKRAGKPGAEGDWLDWLALVTMPDDEGGTEASDEGEADGSQSDA